MNTACKIRTLLIDNGSKTIKEYIELLDECAIEVAPSQDIYNIKPADYELILLSDGNYPSVNKNKTVIELVKTTSVPMIGFCYGFQLICVAYGAELFEMKQKREGFSKINALSGDDIFDGFETNKVYENHRFSVKDISTRSELICHANSVDGCEIIEVKNKKQFAFQFHPELDPDEHGSSVIVHNLIRRWFNL